MTILNDKKMGSMIPQFLLISHVLFCNLDNVYAGVTSTFIRSEWPSVDMPLDDEVFAIPNGYNAPQQVHITQGDYDGKGVIIIWVTPDEPGSNKVKYGTSDKKYDFTVEGTVKNYTFYNYTSPYLHECHIDNLEWLEEEFKKVDRELTPWLIVIMHSPMYNSNSAHYMEGESIRVVFESWFVQYKVDVVFAGHVHAYERSYRISNIDYNITNGVCYPMPDTSSPIYITVGDGGNQEGLASSFNDPQPDYSAFREASYGHSTLEIMNKTHAFYQWNRNDDGKKVATDAFVLHNQYWNNSLGITKLKKNYMHTIVPTIELNEL